MRDTGREVAIHRGRVLVASMAVLAAVATLLYRYYDLQIVSYQQFLTQSERNRVRLEALAPTRGLIYDRKGRLLASNEPSQSLAVVVERAGSLPALFERLDALVGLEDDELERFQERRRRSRPYDAVPLKLRLTDQEVAVIGVHRHTLPGVTIEAQLTRAYPEGKLLAHVVGYVGRINQQEANRIEAEAYRGTYHIGKVGLEKRYEQVLLGQVGNQNIEANAHGRVLRVLDREPPAPGANLDLFLDLELQRVAYEALGEQRGAVVALDAEIGMTGMPMDISAYAVIGAKEPKELVKFANTVGSTMGLKIEAGGDFKKQDFDLPFVPDLYVAAKKKVLAIAAGTEGLEAVKTALGQKAASPLFLIAYDYGRIMTMAAKAGESIGPFGQSDPALQKVTQAQAKMFGLLAMWVYASDRGLGLRVRMDMK